MEKLMSCTSTLRNFYLMKDPVKRMGRQAAEWEKISAYNISKKHEYSECIEKSQNSTIKTNNPIRKWAAQFLQQMSLLL